MSIVIELLEDEKEETMSYQHLPNWAKQHCAMIDAIAFPVRFPADFEIACPVCGDTKEEIEHSELMRLDTNTLLVWNTIDFHCRNCGEIDD